MKLRPYQTSSIESLRSGFLAKHIRQVLAAPTGSGKSVVMVSMIDSAIAKGSRVLFICERRILVEQFSSHLDSIGIDHGVLMAAHWRWRPQAMVQVASVQTLERMETWPAFDVVFIDELHACMRKSIIKMIKAFPDTRIVGATATPFHAGIAEHFSNVANVITMRELVNDGHLVPFRVFIAHEIETAGLKKDSFGEWNKKELESSALKVVGDVVSDYVKISHDVFGRNSKAICFSAGIAHGTELVQKFAEVGVNAVQITCEDDNEYKSDVMKDFARHDTEIDLLVSADILTRGYDQTDIEHVILARPLRKSFSSFVQMVGRGARPHLGKGFAIIQDNSGNWLRFKESWDDLYSNGITELSSQYDSKPRKEPTEKEKKASKCPRCMALWPGNSDTCTHCGYRREKKSLSLTVPGEMLELTGDAPKKEKHSGEYKERFYQMLLGYCAAKGYRDGWAFHHYQEKFKVQPAWKKQVAAPDADVMGWIQHQNIKYAKRRSA